MENAQRTTLKVKKVVSYREKSYRSQLEAVPSGTNASLTSPDNNFMREILGEPRKNKDYTQHNKELDNVALASLQTTEDVGPFTVSGLTLAVQSLIKVMTNIRNRYPDIYSSLGTVGMRSVRLQRSIQPTAKVSNHAWGTAIDLLIDGLLDPWQDNTTQHALALIAPIFNEQGWFWGGAYKPRRDKGGVLYCKEDSMHFEISKESLLNWAALGYLGPDAQNVAKGKQTISLVRTAGRTKNTGKDEAGFTAWMPSKPSIAPLAPKSHPSRNMLIRPLPRRDGEQFSHWLGRTGRSWARKTASWFR